MLYFTGEVFRRLANQNRGHIRVMLEYTFIQVYTCLINCWGCFLKRNLQKIKKKKKVKSIQKLVKD